MNILVVEDEIRLADSLREILTSQRYAVDVANDGEDGLYYATHSEYDCIVLDLMLPKLSGFDVLRSLRNAKKEVPVIILTARDSVGDKVNGLDLGADDYLTKPFSSEELLARIRALTRRKGEVILNEIKYGDLTLSLSDYNLYCGSKQIHLGAKEFDIMLVLMKNSGIVISKDALISKVWGGDGDVMDNNVEAYMSFIRKKLLFLSSNVRIISQRKQGYYLSEGEEQ